MNDYTHDHDNSLITLRDFQSALDVQDACNLSGVVHSFSRAVSTIWKEANRLGKGTAWVNNHPICVLYADKISSLTGSQTDPALVISKAYDIVHSTIEAGYCRHRLEKLLPAAIEMVEKKKAFCRPDTVVVFTTGDRITDVATTQYGAITGSPSYVLDAKSGVTTEVAFGLTREEFDNLATYLWRETGETK